MWSRKAWCDCVAVAPLAPELTVCVPVAALRVVLCCVCSVTFNYLNRDFFNALAEKDVDRFQLQLVKYLIGFAFGECVVVCCQAAWAARWSPLTCSINHPAAVPVSSGCVQSECCCDESDGLVVCLCRAGIPVFVLKGYFQVRVGSG